MKSDSTITCSEVLLSADDFGERLRAVKAGMPDVHWYPYDSMSNVPILRALTDGVPIPTNRVLDVGAADGDLSFLFACAGATVHALDGVSTNFNDGEGLRRLNEAFGKQVSLSFTDIDFGFTLSGQYDLCLAMGLAYHLRNVPLLYITLAQHCQFMVTNTRVIEFTPSGTRIQDEPLAYFLERRELNDDPTNFWLLSPGCYRRVLKRCGWKIVREQFAGAEVGSLETDKRMWALCERVPNHADLRVHHDF